MARAAFLGVLAAALCAVAMTQVVVTPYKTAAPFVRGIVKQWTVDSFGKYPVYIENTATLKSSNVAVINNVNVTGFVSGVQQLIGNNGFALVMSPGPVENFQSGNLNFVAKTANQATNSTIPDPYLNSDSYDDGSTVTWGLIQTPDPASSLGVNSWYNPITLTFAVNLPAGNVSGSFAFCTVRPPASYDNVFDSAFITFTDNSTGITTNVALNYTATTLSQDMTVYYRFGTVANGNGNEGVSGPTVGINANITRCFPRAGFTYTAPTTGNYIVRYTVANYQQVTINKVSQQGFLAMPGRTWRAAASGGPPGG